MVLRTPATHVAAAIEGTISLDVAGTRRSYRLLHPTRVGRAGSCHVRLGGPAIHAEHATISVKGSSWYIEVHSAAPPIEINGLPVRSALLQSGDQIAIGGVRIEFQSPFSPAPPATVELSAGVPRDPTEPKRAWVIDLAQRQTVMDVERAALDAERDEWLIRLAAEKKQINEHARSTERRLELSEDKLRQARVAHLAESRQAKMELELQREQLAATRHELAAERESLLLSQAAHEQAWREMQAEHQRSLAEARGSRAASVKMLAQLQRDRQEIDRRLEEVKQSESRLQQAQSRIERQVEIGAHELAGLQRRIDNERLLLVDLQRRRALADRGPSLVKAWEELTADPAETEAIEKLADQLEAVARKLEEGAAEIQSADARIREQELRLQHWARHLKGEAERLERVTSRDHSREAAGLEQRSRELDLRKAEIERAGDELLAKQTEWSLQRSAWEESQVAERSLITKERERLRQQRWTLAVAHRSRWARLRRAKHDLKKDQARIVTRLAQMARHEARLEVLKQEIGHLRLAQLEQSADKLRAIDPLSPSAIEAQDRARQQRRHCEEEWSRYESRLRQTVEWMEGEVLAPRPSRSRPAGMLDDTEKGRIEQVSAQMALRQQEQAWEAERKKYQEELQRLREELESMAAHMIAPGEARWAS